MRSGVGILSCTAACKARVEMLPLTSGCCSFEPRDVGALELSGIIEVK